jgi:hypothetical protein
MGRIIDTGSTPAKRRRAHERSCAEVLRRLAERPKWDSEGRDMAAFLVFSLRGIYRTIDESAEAWDDRNYWRKAEGLRDKYRWAHIAAEDLEKLVIAGRWDEVPDVLIGLVVHLSHVKITAVTRDADWWVGAYRALTREAAGEEAA